MTYEIFANSQFAKRQSPNLSKLGFDFADDHRLQYLKIQDQLTTAYQEGETMEMLMKRFSIPSSKTMHCIFGLFDIKTRTLEEATRLAISLNRSTPPSGWVGQAKWHTTWDNKRVYLRSSYELKLAEQLDEQNVCYGTEALRIKYLCTTAQKERIAIPDFYLPESNTIIEVKASHWLNSIQMNDKRLAYEALGYTFMLYLDHVMIHNWSHQQDSNLQPVA